MFRRSLVLGALSLGLMSCLNSQAELGDRVSIVKLNIDDNPEAPSRYGVRGIPTMILFKDGQPAATKIGAEPKGRIQAWLEAALSGLAGGGAAARQ